MGGFNFLTLSKMSNQARILRGLSGIGIIFGGAFGGYQIMQANLQIKQANLQIKQANESLAQSHLHQRRDTTRQIKERFEDNKSGAFCLYVFDTGRYETGGDLNIPEGVRRGGGTQLKLTHQLRKAAFGDLEGKIIKKTWWGADDMETFYKECALRSCLEIWASDFVDIYDAIDREEVIEEDLKKSVQGLLQNLFDDNDAVAYLRNQEDSYKEVFMLQDRWKACDTNSTNYV
jgi:hypothetical protein